MIKKLIAIVLLIAVAVFFVACVEIENTDSETERYSSTSENTQEKADSESTATEETEKDESHKNEESIICNAHSYGEWEVVKAPTCGDKGTEEKRCNICGQASTRYIDSVDEHTFMSTGKCKICGTAMNKNFSFYLNEDGQSYSFNYEGNAKSVTVPATFNEKPVTKLGADCFYLCSELCTVTLPDSITEFGTDAFKYCQNLTTINVPASLSVIKSGAFYACTSLSSFTIPQTVTRIESETFYSTNFSYITIPDSVTYIGPDAFSESEIRTLTIPANVSEIGARAFSGCRKLASITIAQGTKLKVIPASAFEGMASLKIVKIAEGVETISNNAFSFAPYLSRVELPSTVLSIGIGAFSYTGLDNVTISYNGSQTQWEQIQFSANWNKSMSGMIIEYKN